MYLPVGHELLPYVTCKTLSDGREYDRIVFVNQAKGKFAATVAFDVTTVSSQGLRATQDTNIGFDEPFEVRLKPNVPPEMLVRVAQAAEDAQYCSGGVNGV